MSVDMEAAADLAANSLVHTPSYVSIYHGGVNSDDSRIVELRWLIFRNICIVSSKSKDYLNIFYNESKEIECFFMMIHSSHSNATLWEQVSAGLLLIPFRVGITVFQQLIAVGEWIDKEEASVIGDRTHYKLSTMVVRPDVQGKGVGTRCLNTAIERADCDSIPILLSTQLEKNVVFYKRLGFEVQRDSCFGEGNEPPISFRSWVMVRETKTDSKK